MKIFSESSYNDELKPNGGDGKNFLMFHIPSRFTRREIEEYALDHGLTNIYWGSSEAPYYGFEGSYNGDMLVVFNDANNLPEGYREDAKRYGEPIARNSSAPSRVTERDFRNFNFRCRKCGKEFVDKYDYPLPTDCGAAVYCPDCGSVAKITDTNPVDGKNDWNTDFLRIRNAYDELGKEHRIYKEGSDVIDMRRNRSVKIMKESVGNEEYLNLEEGVSTASKLFEGDGIGYPSSSGVNVIASLNLMMADVDRILQCVADGDMDMAEKLFKDRLLKHQQQYNRYSETLSSEIKNLLAGLEKSDQMSQKIRKFANDTVVFQGGNLDVK